MNWIDIVFLSYIYVLLISGILLTLGSSDYRWFERGVAITFGAAFLFISMGSPQIIVNLVGSSLYIPLFFVVSVVITVLWIFAIDNLIQNKIQNKEIEKTKEDMNAL